MSKKFEKELAKLLQKHGLKADKPVAPKVKTEKSTKTDPTVVADVAKSIADKLTKAIAKNKGFKGADTKDDLNKHIKSKIFTSWAGVKEIEYPDDLSTLSKDEKIVTFFKALVFANADPQSATVLRALVEGTSADGGYLVPEELRAEIFRILPDLAVMRKLARVIPMTTNMLKLNSLSARPTAYWTAEYASKSTTSAEFGQVELAPNDLVCLLPISEQLLADANINLVEFITEIFAEAIAVAEDRAFFTGSGTGQPRGISIETLPYTVPAGGSLSFDHILSVLDQVPQRVTQSMRTAFVGNRYVKTMLRQLKDNNNNYIWRDGTGPGGGAEVKRLPDTIYGYAFHEQNDLAQSELYFGDWSYYIIGDRQTISVTTTTEGGEAWRRNAMEIKAVERVDGRAVILSPFTKITGI